MNSLNFVKNPLRSSAILNFQNDDKYCFNWTILVHFHPLADSKIGHPRRVSNYRQYFNEINLQCFDISNGFRCSDV